VLNLKKKIRRQKIKESLGEIFRGVEAVGEAPMWHVIS
jgi:hypothetical protein